MIHKMTNEQLHALPLKLQQARGICASAGLLKGSECPEERSAYLGESVAAKLVLLC
jgi:hypothetical protein